MPLRYFYIVLYFFFSFFELFCTNSGTIELNLLSEAEERFVVLDTHFENSFFVKDITVSSDSIFSLQEFKELTGLVGQNQVTLEQLRTACWHLKHKNKFDSVTITKTSVDDGINLAFNFKSSWTFNKIKFMGSILGKDRYQQYYLIESGEAFDMAKHKRSMEVCTQYFKDQGYLNIDLADYITYNSDTKSVNVQVYINNTDQFIIDTAQVAIIMRGESTNTQCKKLQTKIEKMVTANLSNMAYTKALIDQEIIVLRQYLIKKGFLNPKVDTQFTIDTARNRVNFVFTINLHHKKRFIFFGNHFFSFQELLSELLMDTSVLIIPPSLFAQDIIALYKQKGFWSIDVDWKEEDDRYFFIIKEGPRAQIKSVIIKNNIITANTKKCFSPLVSAYFYDVDIYRNCCDKLIGEYIKQGYWDCAIEKREFELVQADNIYQLLITLDTGRQRLLKYISCNNYPEILNIWPFKKFSHLKAACPFDATLIAEQRQWLLDYFYDQGFMHVIIRPELIEHSDGTELAWHIDRQVDPVRFGRTIIGASSYIKPHVLLRELAYNPGDIWDIGKIEQSLKNLRKLNIFQSVSLVPYNVMGQDSAKAILLKYVEDDPFEIRTRLGLQQVSKDLTNFAGTTYIIGGSFLWKNPAAIADMLRLDADITRYTRSFSAAYCLPWILGQPIRTEFKVFSGRYDQPFTVSSRFKLYSEAHDGIAINFTPNYGFCSTNINLGLDVTKLSALSPDLAQVIDFKPQLIDTRIPTLFIEPTVFIDRFDNNINPTSGTFTFLLAKGVWPIGVKNGQYLKLLCEQSFVYPVYSSVIAAVRLRCGHIFNNDFNTILPTERFYLGGPYSIRGYDPNMVPPLNSFRPACTSNKASNYSWVPIGGKTMINLNFELRFPVYKNLGAVIFNDMGVLGQKKISDIMGNQWVGATGFGLRYSTPLGPLRFDIGWKWKKQYPEERPYAWFFTLGHTF